MSAQTTIIPGRRTHPPGSATGMAQTPSHCDRAAGGKLRLTAYRLVCIVRELNENERDQSA